MIYTIGHSAHSADAFLQLLAAHDIAQLADVRSVPRSGRHPHFSQGALELLLSRRQVTSRHFPGLGGMRKPRADSINTAWQQSAFRGYADYMQTKAFDDALDTLLTFAQRGPTAIMCAEAAWWDCHRQLLSDALLVCNVPVLHIMPAGRSSEAKPHELGCLARVEDGKVIYPGLL